MRSAASLVLASAAVARAASSFIPSGISASCTTFLTSLDTNAELSGCTSALSSATSAYAPGGALAASATKAQITSTLQAVCAKADSACTTASLGQQLSSFYVACSAELASQPNAEVKLIYDTVYTLRPLVDSVCAKGDAGDYCIFSTNTSSALASKLASASPNANAKRDDAAASLVPNGAAIGANNLVFLSLFGSTPKDALCTSCTRQVVTAYISFESSVSYGPGMGQSVLLQGQPALMQGIAGTCGADFLSSAAKAAGGLSTGGSATGSSAAVPRAARTPLGLVLALLASLALLAL